MTKHDEPDFDPKPRTAKKQPEGDRATGARIFRTSGPATGTRDEIRRFPNVHYHHQHRQLTHHRNDKRRGEYDGHIHGGRRRTHRRHRKSRSTRRR